MRKRSNCLRNASSLGLTTALFLIVAQGFARADMLSQAHELLLSEADNDHVFAVTVNQTIRINLASNPSTGFTWLTAATSGVSVSTNGTSAYIAGPGTGTGGGGTMSFPFMAVKPGQTVLEFVYVKPWLPHDFAATFTVTFDVGIDTNTPCLSVSLKENILVLSWPVVNSAGFFLEGTKNLSLSQWAALNAMPISDGVNYSVRMPPAGENLFFRLRK